MKIIDSVLAMVRPVRFIVVAFTCALLLLTNAFPAFAIGTDKSDPTQATDQLNQIQRKTDQIATEPPPSMSREQEETSGGGLNEVQGTADIDKMSRPENSQNATTVEDEVKGILEKVTGKK
jgi:hypothetical protein